jgi:Lrp/AsnC family transcriptional regulator for asnA, asnC and gidA
MIDEVDRKIIELLMENARIPCTKIAEKLKLSEGAIRKRISSLETKKVIKKYIALVDPKKLGYHSIAVLGLDADSTQLLNIAHKVADIPEAKNVCISTGDHMVMVDIWAKDGKELSELLKNKIGKIEGVKRICPAIILEKIKEV